MMHTIRSATYRRMPWKNGGGTTQEIVVEPREGPFDYRVSIADVEADGPFSRFDGCDRHIMILSGEGMRLDCGVHGAIDLAPREPRTFSGDWDVRGVLRRGPVRDFNLILARGRMRGSIAFVSAPGVAHADICILHMLSGEGMGDTLVADGELPIPPGSSGVSARLWRGAVS
jgi:environmental stress-induced protein Ves